MLKYILGWALLLTIIAFCTSAKAHLQVTTDEEGHTLFTLYKEVLLDSSTYLPLINTLREAKKGDTVRILVSANQGGAVPTMYAITRAMDQSKATVVVTVKNYAYSAAAVIMGHSTYTKIYYDTDLLWHTGSVMVYLPLIGSVRVTVDKSFLLFMPVVYWDSIRFNRFIHDVDYYSWGNIGLVKNPFQRTWVSREYWDALREGEDVFISGREVCYNKVGLEVYWDTKPYCIVRGTKK